MAEGSTEPFLNIEGGRLKKQKLQVLFVGLESVKTLRSE